MQYENLSPKQKALKINLSNEIYGSFAEIGGGQEVARTFFQAGGASGTIAKTISAYDMKLSDALYGKDNEKRYVCKPRLEKILDTEFTNIIPILRDSKAENTCFFSFANTVTTLNYNKDNEGHGWIGVKFQLLAKSEPNQVVMHVRLLENDGLLHQNTLGVIGVNLLFACFFYSSTPNTFLRSLMDSLSADRIEIDMIEMSGPDLEYVDNRLLSVQLVKNGMTSVSIFNRWGKIQQPADMFYKKTVMVLRGRFRPITYLEFDMLKTAYALFKNDSDYEKESMVVLCEITLNNLLSQDEELDERDFLDRVDILNGMGQNVMISEFREYYKLVSYFSRYKIKNLRLVIGIPSLINVINSYYYKDLKGGILEAFGYLFANNMKFHVYPTWDKERKIILNSQNIDIPEEIKYLYQYLQENRKIIDIKTFKKDWLQIKSAEVLNMIQSGDLTWESKVPKYISEFIKKRQIFGYKESE